MKLSKETINILRNFASINQNILVPVGNTLTTRTVAKNIFVEATVPDTFEQELPIYNLSEFLGVISLFGNPEFDLTENSVIISEKRNRVKYVFASKEVLDYPEKPIKFPTTDAEFELSEMDLRSILKAGAVLSATDLVISGNAEIITATVTDPKNPSANTFSVEVGVTDRTFDTYIKLETLKMIPDIYTVSLSSKKITKFGAKTITGYNFYIAAEKNSTWS